MQISDTSTCILLQFIDNEPDDPKNIGDTKKVAQ